MLVIQALKDGKYNQEKVDDKGEMVADVYKTLYNKYGPEYHLMGYYYTSDDNILNMEG